MTMLESFSITKALHIQTLTYKSRSMSAVLRVDDVVGPQLGVGTGFAVALLLILHARREWVSPSLMGKQAVERAGEGVCGAPAHRSHFQPTPFRLGPPLPFHPSDSSIQSLVFSPTLTLLLRQEIYL